MLSCIGRLGITPPVFLGRGIDILREVPSCATASPLLLVLALTPICLATPSAASVIASYSASYPVSATNWTTTLSFPKFNPALGTLMSVSLEVRTDLVSTFRFENMSTSSTCTSQDSSQAKVELQRPDATLLTSTIAAREYSQTMPVYDGVLNFGGTSGYTALDLALSQTATMVVTAPADLALFSGAGSIVLPCKATGKAYVSDDCGNASHGVSTKAGANVVVTYTYDNATPVSRATWGRIKILYR